MISKPNPIALHVKRTECPKNLTFWIFGWPVSARSNHYFFNNHECLMRKIMIWSVIGQSSNKTESHFFGTPCTSAGRRGLPNGESSQTPVFSLLLVVLACHQYVCNLHVRHRVHNKSTNVPSIIWQLCASRGKRPKFSFRKMLYTWFGPAYLHIEHLKWLWTWLTYWQSKVGVGKLSR